MKRRKPFNELVGASVGIVGTSATLGVGGDIVSGLGGNTGAIDTLGRYQVPLAKVQGGSILLNTLMDFHDITRRKMRRRK